MTIEMTGCEICKITETNPCPNCNKETILSWKIAVSFGEQNGD